MKYDDDALKRLMWHCINLAMRSPSKVGKPLVGALILDSSGGIIGEGYKTVVSDTRYFIHAERKAIMESAGKLPVKGTTLVTTLEPCVRASPRSLFKPCSELIVESGIDAVIIGLLDSSPSIQAGQGIEYLEKNGIGVVVYNGLRETIISMLMQAKYKRTAARSLNER